MTRPPLPTKVEAHTSNVFVLDHHRIPLDPIHPGRARILLSQGKAAVLKYYPFTIVLKAIIEEPHVQPLRIKLDPGSKTTGLAIINDTSGEVVWAAEITHRGQAIKAALDARRALRRSRRGRKTRYRKPRFDNRRREAGWIPPSLASRVANMLTWVQRLCTLCPLTNISMELVKFDLQQMDHPEISGVQYQQGTLAGYETREYLLQKWNRHCVYCGVKDVPLQVEHISPRATGGTNRVSNLTLACEPCNKAKGTVDINVFLASKPDILNRILAQAKAPLKDAAAVNTTRWLLFERLKALGFPVECGSGGQTKFNRTVRGLPKAHWIDATCVGKSTPLEISTKGVRPWFITATGHGARQMCGTNKHGLPIRQKQRQKRYYGFQTGDMVRAVVPSGKKQGVHTGRVLVRATGSFDIRTQSERVQGISHRYCRTLYRCDGYRYQIGDVTIPHHA
ncbi:MAG TPA: RNA-guided endonuclease IscB [Ktedonobacteraceae bacterium]|nr:RNA-guided endonuclease IscB [Ktedonobacteraceae bacterium]